MAIQTVGIGSAPNDNTGDTPRTGISKLNSNFTDPTNAASRLVQASPTDATEGRVMTVGAFGLGESVSTKTINWDTEFDTTGNVISPFVADTTSTNGPSPNGYYYPLVSSYNTANNNKTVIAIPYRVGTEGMFLRSRFSGVWGPWQPVYTGANLVKAQNVSGGTVLASGTTAGANLVPAQSGNWSPATDTANNARNLWMKQ